MLLESGVVSTFQLIYQNFPAMHYERYIIRRRGNDVIFNFLQSALTTWSSRVICVTIATLSPSALASVSDIPQ